MSKLAAVQPPWAGQEALSCITVWRSDRWMILHPLKLQAEGVRMQFHKAILSFFLAVYALLAISGHHLPLGWDQNPGPFAVRVSCTNTASVEPCGIYFLARLSQSSCPISTFHALIQGLLTAPTALEHLCSQSALSLHLHVDTTWAIVQVNIKNKVQVVDTVHTERREGKLSPSVSKGVLRMWHLC